MNCPYLNIKPQYFVYIRNVTSLLNPVFKKPAWIGQFSQYYQKLAYDWSKPICWNKNA